MLTDSAGVILNANRAASRLLNVSATHLEGRELLVFSHERQTFLALLEQIAQNRSPELGTELMLRLRERKPLMMQLYDVTAPDRDRACTSAVADADWRGRGCGGRRYACRPGPGKPRGRRRA